jgi:hypothetical protein
MAGCTQETGMMPPSTGISEVIPDLHDLVLSPAEVPSCFSLTDQHGKSPGDVGKLARELGWQAGYEITYTCPEEGAEPTVLVHTIAVYPPVNMPGLLSMVEVRDRPEGFTFVELSFADNSLPMRGFYGKAPETMNTTISSGNPVVDSLREAPGNSIGNISRIAEIIFYRGSYFEVIRMTGPGTNTTVLETMAGAAYAKIP